ncbi:hypothetical protein [Nocardia barduliensis]|uniref:hypothetical protein n=1 Tax=Nocardia barduliensis TaxID=2736643 RepID=UPI0015735B19|nr:hypothetical protein [Nocardia barduliensis]
MTRTTKLVLGGFAVAVSTFVGAGVASADESQPWEGDHTPITSQMCVDGGGVLDGLICRGGLYEGFIVAL